jgi:gas vesicle protein
MSAKQILIGTISGLVAGAVVGLMVAPTSGAETRQKIADSAEGLKKKLKKLKRSAASEIDDLEEVFSSQVSGLKDDVREKILKLIAQGKDSYNNIKQEASSIKQEASSNMS